MAGRLSRRESGGMARRRAASRFSRTDRRSEPGSPFRAAARPAGWHSTSSARPPSWPGPGAKCCQWPWNTGMTQSTKDRIRHDPRQPGGCRLPGVAHIFPYASMPTHDFCVEGSLLSVLRTVSFGIRSIRRGPDADGNGFGTVRGSSEPSFSRARRAAHALNVAEISRRDSSRRRSGIGGRMSALRWTRRQRALSAGQLSSTHGAPGLRRCAIEAAGVNGRPGPARRNVPTFTRGWRAGGAGRRFLLRGIEWRRCSASNAFGPGRSDETPPPRSCLRRYTHTRHLAAHHFERSRILTTLSRADPRFGQRCDHVTTRHRRPAAGANCGSAGGADSIGISAHGPRTGRLPRRPVLQFQARRQSSVDPGPLPASRHGLHAAATDLFPRPGISGYAATLTLTPPGSSMRCGVGHLLQPTELVDERTWSGPDRVGYHVDALLAACSADRRPGVFRFFRTR